MRIWSFILASMVFAGWARCAAADDPFSAIRKFGLLGTWSETCDTRNMTGTMTLVRFTETSLGLPRLIVGQPDFITFTAMITQVDTQSANQMTLDLAGPLGVMGSQLSVRLQAGALQFRQGGAADWSAALHLCISE